MTRTADQKLAVYVFGATLDEWADHQRDAHPLDEWAMCDRCRALLDELDAFREMAYR